MDHETERRPRLEVAARTSARTAPRRPCHRRSSPQGGRWRRPTTRSAWLRTRSVRLRQRWWTDLPAHDKSGGSERRTLAGGLEIRQDAPVTDDSADPRMVLMVIEVSDVQRSATLYRDAFGVDLHVDDDRHRRAHRRIAIRNPNMVAATGHHLPDGGDLFSPLMRRPRCRGAPACAHLRSAERGRPGCTHPTPRMLARSYPLRPRPAHRAPAKPLSRSARMSSMVSRPTDKRTRLGSTPVATCSCSLSWLWVVVAGWMARLRTSPMLAT